MSVLMALKRYMEDSGFIEVMKLNGFSMGKEKLWFYRLRGEFVDCLTLQVLASGKGVRFHVSTYVFDMFPDYDRKDFPKGFIKVKTNLTHLFLNEKGVGFSSGNWDTSGKGRAIKSFFDASNLVVSDLVPWFDRIDNRKKLFDTIFDPEDGVFDFLIEQ